VKLQHALMGLLGLGLLAYGACAQTASEPARPRPCRFGSAPNLLACASDGCLLCTTDHSCRWIDRWRECR
jgi:hypothetical protein